MAESEDRNRELFEQFKALHAQSQSEEGTGDQTLDTLLRTVEPSFADLIQSLAVPHWFNEEIIATTTDADTHDRASKLFEDILALSFIRSHHRGYAYHDVARDNLRRYLARKDPGRFRGLSQRLAQAFAHWEQSNVDEEINWERTYLTLAFDEKVGFDSLNSLITAARRDRRFTVVETLTQMAAEQNMLLSSNGSSQVDYYRALLAFDFRRWEEADKRFKELNIANLHNSFSGRAQLYRGMTLEARGMWDDASRVYQSCLKQISDSDETHGLVARLHGRLAESYLSQGDLKKAEAHAEKSIAINQKSGDPYGEAINFETLGRIYTKFRDLTRAQEAFEKSIEILDRAGREIDKAKIFSDLAMLYSSFAKQEDAQRYYKKALDVKIAAGDNYGLAFIYSNLGNLYLQGGSTEDAFRHFRSSLIIFQQFKDHLNSAKVLRSIALTYERLENFDSALDYMQQAEKALPSQSPWKQAYQKELHRFEKLLQQSKHPTWKKTGKVVGMIAMIILGVLLFFLAIGLIVESGVLK